MPGGELITGSLLVNGAVSLAFAAMPALIVAEVLPTQTGVANSVNSISRSVGSSLASALVVTLLASEVLPNGLPRESAYVTSFVLGAVACVAAGLLVTLGLPRLGRSVAVAPAAGASAAAPEPARPRLPAAA